MKIAALVVLCFASLLANPYVEPDPSGIGMGVLMIWPTARSTALAGAMTGLADEADAVHFNPGGLAFQTTAKASVTGAEWLPGLYPGMYYVFAAGGAPLHLSFMHGRSAYVAGSVTRMSVGETDVVDEHGNFLGRFEVWRAALAAHGAVSLSDEIGTGVSLKLLRSAHARMDDWMWELGPNIGLESGGNATAVAADVALSCRPSSKVSIGLAVTNVGPKIRYYPDSHYGSPYSAALPSMARLGVCWTPVESRNVRLRVMPELDKVLIGVFRDTTGRKPLGRKLEEEWQDVWKALGIEAVALKLVSLRLGYFEDLTNQRGGIVLEKDGSTYHYGLGDVLTRRNLGTFERIGLCWGFGLGTDRLRFDLSSDAAIYDFPTENWKLQLTCNDIGGLF